MLQLVLTAVILGIATAGPALRIQIHYSSSNSEIFYKSQNLPSNWLKKVSVVEAIEGNWILYKGANFQGSSRVVLEGQVVDLRGDWNDVLSSIRYVGSGCIKRGIDYQGNDIVMKSEISSVKRCLRECRGHRGCKSVAYEASTLRCWLKHTENGKQVNVKASVDSANVACAFPALRLQPHKSSSISEVLYRSQSLAPVCLSFAAVAEAVTGNWIIYSEPNFKGKSSVILEGAKADISAFGKVGSTKVTGRGCIKRGIDYWGNDIVMKPNIMSVRQCLGQCRRHAGCKSVAYQSSSRNCWLKHTEFGKRVDAKASVDSANVSCFFRRSDKKMLSCVHNNYDFWGADLGMVDKVASLGACVKLCKAKPGCKSVAYSLSAQCCWPKSKFYGEKPAPKAGIQSVSMQCEARYGRW